MENIIVLAEWHGSSFSDTGFLIVILSILLLLTFGSYILTLLIDKDSLICLLIFSGLLAILLWFPLNNCIRHRGETFQEVATLPQITQQQLEEKYDTADLITKTTNCPEGMICWKVSFKQVD